MDQLSPQTKNRPDFAELIIAIACGMAITSTALFLGVMPMVRHLAGARDYVVYWATGQQLVHHANPYDPVAMGELERGAGFDGKRGSYYMRNPPWALPLALPLGYIGPRVAALPWSLLMLAILIGCVRVIWKLFGRPGTHLEWLGYCFPPALQCVIMGQTSLFLLLGLVLFLRLHRTRPFWAGVSLWLCTLKPHLFVPFGVALLLWIVVSRSYRVLAGALAAIAASCVITWLIDPAAFTQYAHWAHTSGIANEFIPCFAVELRNLIDPSAKWLVSVPAIPGSIWAVVYFWRRRDRWDWLEHGNALVLVSILVAPYCWIYDQSLAMPALMFAAWRSSSRTVVAVLALLYIWLEIQPFYTVGLHSAWYLWPAPAWLSWYIYARRAESRAAVASPMVPEPAVSVV